MAQDYTDIDMAIQQVIGTKGAASFHDIAMHVGRRSKPLAEQAGVICSPDRIVDRRLQALRKLKRIEFVRGSGWRLRKG